MSSKRQQKAGYPLPADEFTEETQSFCITIPAGDEYRMAMIAQLRELGNWWKWKRDTDRPTAATDAAMTWRSLYEINENCEGGFLMTPEQFYDANRRSIYDAWNDIAKQVVSGRTTNINVDGEGAVSDPSTGEGVEIPPTEDDPATPIDETLASRAGGVINTRLWIQRILNDMAAWHFAAVPILAVPNRLATLYGFDPTDIDEWVTYYWNTDPSPDTVITLLSSLDSQFFCRGLSSQSFANYALNIHTPTTDRETLFQLAPHLTQELLNKWYETGTDTMATDYLGYSCVKIPSYSFTLQIGVTLNDPVVLKANHRYQVTAQGYMLDSADGDIQDAWFRKTTTGLPVYNNSDFNIQIGGAVKIDPTTFEVTYDAVNHRYVWTMDMGSSSVGAQWTWSRNSGMAAGTTTSPSGGLAVSVVDLGEIGI